MYGAAITATGYGIPGRDGAQEDFLDFAPVLFQR
jgi:hypothetical protein